MRLSLGSFLFCLCALVASAQAPERYIFSVRHYGTAEGLPQRSVNAIAQDHRGFIWLATPRGLARFDGYTFVNHTRTDGLTMDAVLSVVCDGDGLLWLWHPDGSVDIFDPRTGTCRTLQQHFAGRSPAPTAEQVLGVKAGTDGTIAFTQPGKLFRYRTAREGLASFPLTCSGTPEPCHVDAQGAVWIQCTDLQQHIGVSELLRIPARGADKDLHIPFVKRVANMGARISLPEKRWRTRACTSTGPPASPG